METTSKLDREFIERVKEMVEGLGYVLQVDYDSIHDVKSKSIDKTAYLKSISDLNAAEAINHRKNDIPYAVVIFDHSQEVLNGEKDLALILFDNTQENRGVVKMIDVNINNSNCTFSLKYKSSIPCIQNMIYHDKFPGEERLRFPVDVDSMDEMNDHWEDYVNIIQYPILEKKNYSWLPNDYKCEEKDSELKELGDLVVTALGQTFSKIEKYLITQNHKKGRCRGKVVMLDALNSSKVSYKLVADDIPSDIEIEDEYYIVNNKEVVVVAQVGNLRPTIIDAKESIVYVPLSKMAVIELNGEFDAEYLVRELQKDYVTNQITDKEHISMDRRGEILRLVKIRIPLAHDSLSSIEMQRISANKELKTYIKYLKEELERERSKYLRKYKDICEYCQEEKLKNLLIKLEKDEISDDTTMFNEVRQIVEWVQEKSPGYLCKHKENSHDLDKDVSLNKYSTSVGNDYDNTPEYIARSFHICVSLGNEGSHMKKFKSKEKTRKAPRVTKSVEKGNAPYAAKSVIYSLLNILYWCKDLEKGNNNI